jgi:membrane protease YdiL (CAAX protease family)
VTRRLRPAQTTFATICVVSAIALLAYDRPSAYIALSAFAYGAILWLITRAFVAVDLPSEDAAFKTTARGWRLAVRALVVVAALSWAVFGRQWFWNGPFNGAIQHLSVGVGLGNGDTALPNFFFDALIPGALLLALGAKPIELGLTAWRRGSWQALLGALVLPAIIVVTWFANKHGTTAVPVFFLAHNFLSNGFSEEFMMRGMVLSHLRAFLSKEWSLVVQAVLFGLFHINVFRTPDNWWLECARNVAMNAPMGYFLALIALRARSILLPGLIHTTLDTMDNLIG